MQHAKLAVGAALAVAACACSWGRAQSPGAAELRLNRGVEQFMKEDYDSARAQFSAALQYDSEFAAAHYFLGLTYLQLASRTSDAAAQSELLKQALEEFDRSRALDPQLVTAYLDGAIAQAILGRFADATSSLSQFLETHPDEPMPYLFLAIIYYRQAQEDAGQLDAAEQNLQRAAEALGRQSTPDRTVESYIKFYQALVFLKRNDQERARQSLQEGVAAAPDTAAAQRNQALLERLEKGGVQARRPWDLTLRAGLDFDTNVILRGKDMPLDDPRISDQSDWRFGIGSELNYRFFENEEWVFGLTANTYNSWHCDIHDFNVQTYGAGAFAGYAPKSLRWLTLGMRYDYDFSLVGNEAFLSRHRLTPQISVAEAEWTRSTLFYQFDKRDYRTGVEQDALDRDGDLHAVGLVQDFELFKLFERPVTASGSYRFENFSTVGSEFANTNNIFGVGLQVPLPENFAFDFRSEWECARYKNRSVFSSVRDARRDAVNTLTFGLSKQFNEHVALRFGVDWTQADSNISDEQDREPFSYDRVIYGLTLTCKF